MSENKDDVIIVDGEEFPLPTPENVFPAEANECVSQEREMMLLTDKLDCKPLFVSDETSFLDFSSEEHVLEVFSRYFGKALSDSVDVTQPAWLVIEALKKEYPGWPEDQEWIEFVLRNSDWELADAQTDLGARYADGDGVRQDFEKAEYWYRQAAGLGNARAMTNLGKLYAAGNGVSQDWGQATEWFRKAAEGGDDLAQFYLAASYAEGTGVDQDSEKAFYWYRQSAEQGCALGQYYLGKCYEEGFGVEQNDEEARVWYGKAAEQGVDHESEQGC